MKKVILILLLLLTTKVYGWDVEIYTPNTCLTMPTPIIANNLPHYWQCQFEVRRLWSGQWRYYIYYISNGNEYYLTQGVTDGNEVVTRTIAISSQYGSCLNQTCTLKVRVNKIHTSEWETAYAYFVPYHPFDQICATDLRAAINGSSALHYTSNVNFQHINPCGIPAGVHPCDVYKITQTIDKNSNQIVELIKPNSMGFSGASDPQTQEMWCHIESQTCTTATLITFVYYLKDLQKWNPCCTTEAAMVYRLFDGLNPTITSNLPPYGVNGWRLDRTVTGTFTTETSVPVTSYTWSWYLCNSTNYGVWPLDEYGLRITTPANIQNMSMWNHNYQGASCTPTESGPTFHIGLRVRVSKDQYVEFSDFYRVKPTSNLPPGGCPWLYVHDSIDYLPDNNILHRSEYPENVGNDITDKYVLTIPPYFNNDPTDNTCSIKIQETEDSYCYFDNVKLFAIDHPLGSNVAVTENNDIVIYYPDPTSPSLALNNGEDVTDELQYNTPETIVEGDEGYLTTAEYSYGDNYQLKLKENIYGVITNAFKGYRNALNEKKGLGDSSPGDTVALIFDPYDSDFNSIVSKNHESGIINAFDYENDYESGDIPFAKRQYRSDVVIPLDQDLSIDYVTIDWSLDYALSHLAVSTFFYDGYVEEELELIEAINGDDDVKSQLLDIDEVYAEMDNSSDIIMKFQKPSDSIQAGWVRDYVFITTGRYDASGGDNPPANNPISGDNIIPNEYKLHQNYPNPFNPVTTIKYDIPKDGEITLKIYDLLGKEVYSYSNYMKAGYYSIDFNASHLASGVYFYMIKSGDFTKTKKMLFIK